MKSFESPLTLTAALGRTLPEESSTVPVMVAPTPWADSRAGDVASKKAATLMISAQHQCFKRRCVTYFLRKFGPECFDPGPSCKSIWSRFGFAAPGRDFGRTLP